MKADDDKREGGRSWYMMAVIVLAGKQAAVLAKAMIKLKQQGRCEQCCGTCYRNAALATNIGKEGKWIMVQQDQVCFELKGPEVRLHA